jgi:hypothetical protein
MPSCPPDAISFVVIVAACLLGSPARAAETLDRPHMLEACSAWRDHIYDLIEQHRLAGEIDENARFDFLSQLITARDKCTFGTFEAGLRMYEEIELGRVHGALK